MKALQRVVWSDGMLMAPQHFQQQDRYFETLLDTRVLFTLPYPWGAYSLEMDGAALASNRVAMRSFRGVLSRGTVVSFAAGESEAPAARAIEDQFPAHKARLDVFLALALERPGVASYAKADTVSPRTRHTIEPRSVLDTVTPHEELTVEFARYNTMLLFGEEARDDYESVKIAEIVRDSSGKLCYHPAYVPPALRVSAAPFIMEGLRSTLAASVAKRGAIAEERRQRDASSVEFAADEVGRYLALNALSKAIPLLKHVVDDGQLSPYQTYLALIQFAGELTTFSAKDDPAEFPPYHHHDLGATFHGLFTTLMSLLNLSVASNVVTISLESRPDGMHLGRIQDAELFKPGVRFVLAVRAQAPEHKVYELVPRVAKVASWSEIPKCLSSALSGVGLAPASRPPREIPIRPDKCYFFVATDQPSWRGIANERAIAVHLPPPFAPQTTAVELFAIPPE